MNDGTLKDEFKEELQRIAAQERLKEKLEMLDSQAATQDLFGVLRRQCEACQGGCPGY